MLKISSPKTVLILCFCSSPKTGHAFCENHSETVKTLGYSSELRKFLREAGADPDTFTKEGQSKV